MAGEVHRLYLIPGMFGFGKLAGYDYGGHVERALLARVREAGMRCTVQLVPTPPTASIRRRARVLAHTLAETAGDRGPIHLIGHSTGGLDARLLASPTAHLGERIPTALQRRIASVVSLNTPHHGTPLAHFFATVSGTRLLYALSLLTFTTLRYGGPPLTVFSTLVATVGKVDEAFGVDIHLLDRTTDLLLRFVGDQGRAEVHEWMDGIRRDQGGIVQIMPECMDLFNATTEDASGVRYGCIATAAPPPRSMRFLGKVRSPYQALSATIYSTLHTFASRPHKNYPCPDPDADVAARLERALGHTVTDEDTDGIVPTRSMLHGELLWAGMGDHLDVLGHFHDDQEGGDHVDWLTSGADFDRRRFQSAMDAVAQFVVRGA